MKTKQPIPIVVLALVVGLVGTVHGFSNEPEDFRGIKWGTHIDQCKELYFVEPSVTWMLYQRNNENLKMDEAKFEQIEYYFYKDRFHSVKAHYVGEQNLLNLKKTLSSAHGRGIKHVKGYSVVYQWRGSKVGINIEYNRMSKKGALVYTYSPISAEIAKDKKQLPIQDEGQPLK
jgi:hypothetical protein